jgi:hypothetical protein
VHKKNYSLFNKNFLLAVLLLAVGTAAAATMPFVGVRGLNIGLFCGFFPTGLGCLIIELKTAKSAELQKRAEMKNEERSVFIRAKAGSYAFWISYAAVFLLWLAAAVIRVDSGYLAIALLVLMPAVYFSVLAVCGRRY